MKLLYLFCFGLLIISCGEKSKEIIQETYPKLRLERGFAALEDSFAINSIDLENFKTKYSNFQITKELRKNVFKDNLIDTLFHLTNGRDTFYVYESGPKKFLDGIRIHSNRFVFEKEIRLGITKNDFYHRFPALDSIKQKPDRVLIWMEMTHLSFEFNADTLYEVDWSMIID